MGAPTPGSPVPGYANSEEKTWALIAHFGGIIVGFIAPLVALLVKGNESPTVRAHAVEALNFQITWNVALIVGQILAICTGGFLFFLPLACWAVIVIFSVIAGLRANEGQLYSYPISVRLVK
jgi:uncharacterized protein